MTSSDAKRHPPRSFELPAAVAEAFERRIASHNWDPDRVAAASILHFIENADLRADMLRRLIEVQSGSPTHTPPQDVLEHHRDEVFGIAASDLTDSPGEPAGSTDSANAAGEHVVDVAPQDLSVTNFTLDEIAENLARFTDSNSPTG